MNLLLVSTSILVPIPLVVKCVSPGWYHKSSFTHHFCLPLLLPSLHLFTYDLLWEKRKSGWKSYCMRTKKVASVCFWVFSLSLNLSVSNLCYFKISISNCFSWNSSLSHFINLSKCIDSKKPFWITLYFPSSNILYV